MFLFRVFLFIFFILSFSNHSLKANKELVDLERDFFSTSNQIDHIGLSKRLNYTFRDPKILQQALRPLLPTPLQMEENKFELLEFLGDRALGLSIIKRLMNRFPDGSKIDIHFCFVELTKNTTLTSLYRSKLMLENFLPFPGKGRSARYCDIAEAIIGAIELDDKDNGSKNVDHFLEHLIDDTSLDQLMNNTHSKSPVVTPPQSDVKVQVMQGNQVIGEGTGKSRSEAKELAAEQAYKYLHRNSTSKMILKADQSYKGRLFEYIQFHREHQFTFIDVKPSTTNMSSSSTSTNELFPTNSLAKSTAPLPLPSLEESVSSEDSSDDANTLQQEAVLKDNQATMDLTIRVQKEASLKNIAATSTQSSSTNSNAPQQNAKKIKAREAAEKNRQKQLSMKKKNTKGLRIAQLEAERKKTIEDALEKTRNTVLDYLGANPSKSSLPTRSTRTNEFVPTNLFAKSAPLLPSLQLEEIETIIEDIDD